MANRAIPPPILPATAAAAGTFCSMAKRKAGIVRHVRLLTDGLIDESGSKWDRITGSQWFYLTHDEAEPFVESACRFLTTHGYGSRAVDVDRQEFTRLASHSPDHRVQAFRASNGSGEIIATIDASDC